MMATEEITVGEIERNPEEIVRARITEFRGRNYVDLRTYYLASNDEWRPTKKGVSIGVESFVELEELMTQIRAKLEEQELVETRD